jgi:hypothetical protein
MLSQNSMDDPSPIIDYARTSMTVNRLELRREGDSLRIIIPPPALWRMLLLMGLRIAGLLILSLLPAALLLGFAQDSGSIAGILISGLLLLAILARLVTSAWRFVQVARHGRKPAVLTVAASDLAVQLPPPWGRGTREWAAGEIVDVNCRETGAMPVIAGFLNLEVVLSDDRFAVVKIPWRGNEPWASVQDNVRDALGLSL